MDGNKSGRNAAPTEADVERYYEEHADEFRTTEMVRASHILQQAGPGRDVGTIYTDLLNARERIMAGADFAEVAGEHSHCNDRGGDLGWFRRGQMVQTFEDVVFAMEPGQVSDVFQSEFGYHIAKVFEKRPAGRIPLEEVREFIRERLAAEREAD
jgi:parvulin-like peptidyl-prolyl isomerase